MKPRSTVLQDTATNIMHAVRVIFSRLSQDVVHVAAVIVLVALTALLSLCSCRTRHH